MLNVYRLDPINHENQYWSAYAPKTCALFRNEMSVNKRNDILLSTVDCSALYCIKGPAISGSCFPDQIRRKRIGELATDIENWLIQPLSMPCCALPSVNQMPNYLRPNTDTSEEELMMVYCVSLDLNSGYPDSFNHASDCRKWEIDLCATSTPE